MKQAGPHLFIAGVAYPGPEPVRRGHRLGGAPGLPLRTPPGHQSVPELLNEVEVGIFEQSDRVSPVMQRAFCEVTHLGCLPDNALTEAEFPEQFERIFVGLADEVVETL